MDRLDNLFDLLPPDLLLKVEEYAQALLESVEIKQPRTLDQTWAGALRDLRDTYTSQQLKKQALDWRDAD